MSLHNADGERGIPYLTFPTSQDLPEWKNHFVREPILTCVGANVCECGGPELALVVSPKYPLLHLLSQDLSLNQNSMIPASLAGQLTPGFPLPLSPEYWCYGQPPAC